MKKLFIIIFLNIALFGTEIWHTDYHKALEIAQKENKHIYMLVVSSDCQWCKKFKATTLKDWTILEKIDESYTLLMLNRDIDYIPRKFQNTPIPFHYFLTNRGKIVYPVAGYRDIDSFHQFLDTAQDRFNKEKNKDNK